MATNLGCEAKANLGRLAAELFQAGASKRSIARRLGVSFDTVNRMLTNADVKAPKEDPVKAMQRRCEEREAERRHIESLREVAFRDFLENVVRSNVPPMPAPTPVQAKPAPRKGKAGHQRYPLLTLTDWHFEERVRPDGVLGLNSYDIATACRRVHRVIRAVIDWKNDLEAAGRFSIPEITVALLGDMMTGTLHGLERHSGADNIVKAVLACGDLLALALRDLAKAFPKVNVVGVVGNHGRLPDDRKVPTKDPTRSWDFLAYNIARRRLESMDAIKWTLPDSYGVLFDVGSHRCYAAHGNFIPNNLGVVGYGIRRFASALSSNMSAAGRPLKYAFFGHWHQSNAAEFAGMQAFICPSLIGTQEYSFLSGGSVNRPAQALYVMDKELGLVSQETIYGEGPKSPGTYEITL